VVDVVEKGKPALSLDPRSQSGGGGHRPLRLREAGRDWSGGPTCAVVGMSYLGGSWYVLPARV